MAMLAAQPSKGHVAFDAVFPSGMASTRPVFGSAHPGVGGAAS